MLIPASFQAAYEAELAIAREVEGIAGGRLRKLCRERHWLFDERVKDAESVLAKLQLGRTSSMRLLPDFYAAVVVVPTRAQLTEAIDSVRAQFARSEVSAAQRPFEVQVRTGLEYAWWLATHDTVFKGGLPEWPLQRIASEVRASLELLDAILADLAGAASLHPARAITPDEALIDAITLAEAWPEIQRPRDLKRFGATIVTFAQAAGISIEEIRDALIDPANRDLVGLPGITPAQGCLAVMLRKNSAELIGRLREAGLTILVSPEMLEQCPEFDGIGMEQRVQLNPES
jgi:hypothetical protein